MRLPSRALLPALLLAGALQGGCRQGPGGPNVVMVVVDTMRADRLAAYGETRGVTPFLDQLAGRSTVFAHAYAASAWTNPSIASLFTSRYPTQHQVSNFGTKIAAGEVMLAEKLAAAGYVTVGFTANPQLTAAEGYARGFRSWNTFPSFKARGAEVRKACAGWLDGGWDRSRGYPLFLFLQLMEPHAPYEPPPAFRERFAPGEAPGGGAAAVNDKLMTLRWEQLSADDVAYLRALYDGEVAAVDAELRLLFEDLEKRGVLDGAIVVVTADHGEEFMEHGLMSHGTTLFNQAIHVPLLMQLPGRPPGAAVVRNVSLVDVAPTVLDLLHQAPELRFVGRSLVPLLDGGGEERDVIAELLLWRESLDWRRHQAALIRGSVKLLMPTEQVRMALPPRVYDLAQDPLETWPNPASVADQSGALQEALRAWLAVLAEGQSPASAPRELDEEQRKKLRALGYVR